MPRAKWRWSNIPVPEPYLVALAVGIVGHIVRPLTIFNSGWQGHVTGWPLVLAGVLLAARAVLSARTTSIAEPARLIVTGPFRFSRNPMYLAWTLLALGIGLGLNNAWIVALVAVAWLFVHAITVPREERHLAARFGEEFRRYRSTVRRWL